MVRILEVKELGTKKQELRARSEIYRQTLALEAANVKLSLVLLKKELRVLRTAYRLVGWAVPISGLLFGHKKRESKSGLLSRFLAGFNLATRIKALFHRDAKEEPAAEEADGTHRFQSGG
jgi:hypothetical protein